MMTVLVVAVGIATIAGVWLERTRRHHLRVIARSSLRVRIGHALAEGLIAGNPLTDVLRILVPDRADWCVLHLVEGEGVRRAAVVHTDPEVETRMRATFERLPFPVDARMGPANVIRTGQPELDREFSPAMLENQPDPSLLRAAGLASVMSVPLKARHGIVGALTMARRIPHAYDVEDLAWAQDVAHRIGLAVENRRLYAEARQLFEQTVSANFVSTPDGAILACNHTFAALLGFESPEAALVTPASALYIEPAARDTFLARLRTQKRLVGYELSLRRRDGAVVTVIAEAVGEFDDAGQLTKMRGFLLDRTAQRELEERLRQAQRLEAVGQLAGGVAHDFDNLITLIIGCADLLKVDGLGEGAEGPTPLDELRKAAMRAASLTQQLLAFSRRQILQPRLLRLNEVLRGLHSMLRRHVPARVVLILELDARVEYVQADPGQLERAILNLVTNAVDAMPAAGTITVTTSLTDGAERDAEQDSSMVPGRYVALSVQDTGVGMDEATCARVFEPFFTTKAVGTASGLGLSTVYGIVKQSGGYVRITSAPDAGTVVRICLPAVIDRPPAADLNSPQPSRELPPIPSGPATAAGY